MEIRGLEKSEYNRDLVCIPHRIGDPHAFGTHLFIRLGATLVTAYVKAAKAKDAEAIYLSTFRDPPWNALPTVVWRAGIDLAPVDGEELDGDIE